MIELALHTDNWRVLSRDYRTAVESALKHGLSHVEMGVVHGQYFMNGLGFDPAVSMQSNPRAIRGYLDQKGVRVSQLDAAYPMMGPDGSTFGVQYVQQAIRFAAELGCPIVDTTDGPAKIEGYSDEDIFRITCENYKQCLPWAEDYKVIIDIETHGPYTTNGDFLERFCPFRLGIRAFQLRYGQLLHLRATTRSITSKRFRKYLSNGHIKDVSPALAAAARGEDTGIACSEVPVGGGVNAENIKKCVAYLRETRWSGVLSHRVQRDRGEHADERRVSAGPAPLTTVPPTPTNGELGPCVRPAAQREGARLGEPVERHRHGDGLSAAVGFPHLRAARHQVSAGRDRRRGESISSFVKLWSGRLCSDRGGTRKGFVVFGYATGADAASGRHGRRPLAVVGLRVAERIGKGVRNPPRDALIAESTPAEARGRAFGFNQAMDHLARPSVPWRRPPSSGSIPTPCGSFSSGCSRRDWPWSPWFGFGLRLPREPRTAAAPRGHGPWTLRPFGRGFRLYLASLVVFTLGNSTTFFLDAGPRTGRGRAAPADPLVRIRAGEGSGKRGHRPAGGPHRPAADDPGRLAWFMRGFTSPSPSPRGPGTFGRCFSPTRFRCAHGTVGKGLGGQPGGQRGPRPGLWLVQRGHRHRHPAGQPFVRYTVRCVWRGHGLRCGGRPGPGGGRPAGDIVNAGGTP